MTRKQYDRLVKEGLELVAQQTYSQFKLGENALKIEPMGARSGGRVAPDDEISTVAWSIRMYAEDVGVPESTLAGYRWVASRWPRKYRVAGVSYYIHKILAGVGDPDDPEERHELLLNPPLLGRTGEYRWTVDSAARHVGWRPSHAESEQERIDRIHDLAKDDQVATRVITDFLRRPTVAYEAMEDQTARHAVNAAQIDRSSAALGKVRERTPEIRRTEHSADYVDLVSACQLFVSSASRIVPKLRGNDFTEEERRRIHNNTARVRATADWIESAADTGNVGMDDELAQLLRGE
ncbi:DUF6192 family protein [Nocardia sp. NPDC058499]|uniref:DUF6192 family protein n=1 Tax=Nocardia sp. NPDC058499 TaxID=3346530 RepID=UPI0036608360